MKKTLTLATTIALGALTLAAQQYKVTIPMPEDAEGAMARMVNYDTGAAIDSVLVEDGAATFTGNITAPALARVMVDGTRMPVFILEPGNITIANRQVSGTPYNDKLQQVNAYTSELENQFRTAASQEKQKQIYDRYSEYSDSVFNANKDNIFGYYMFLNGDLSQMTADQLRAELAKYPAFAGYTRIQKYLEMAQRRQDTQPGGKFIDFAITQPDGKVEKLSDYVGKGKYTLVDFWASWCGPCIRQTVVLKDIYNKYKNDPRLQVLGVAVWDKVEDTQRAIKQHELPWHSIVDAQSIPTDLYGITGIPCIILFGPDGKIISRDLQDDALKASVDQALAQ